VVERIRRDPWVGQPAPGDLPEFHTLAFGEWGLVFYLILERHNMVLLLDIIWAGA
jgi:hypothetical protein